MTTQRVPPSRRALRALVALVGAIILGLAPSGATVVAKEPTVTLRLVLFRPSDGAWTPIACGASITGVGNVRVVGYATVEGATRIRIGYGAGTGVEAWYATGLHAPPAGVESSVVDIVQDLILGESEHNFRLTVPGLTSDECSLTATAIPAFTEGDKSPRLPASDAVDALSLDVTSYKTGEAIFCGTSAPQSVSGRVNFSVKARNAADLRLHFHMHNERPQDNGPDQDGDLANRRFWEGAFNYLFVPAGGAEVDVLIGVNGAHRGRNAFHFGQQAATTASPMGVEPESVCTITNTG